MRWSEIENATKKANAFLRAKRVLEFAINKEDVSLTTGCKESSALRRASMCLTRALAEMRKP